MNWEAVNTHIIKLSRAQWKLMLINALIIKTFDALGATLSAEGKEAANELIIKVSNANDEMAEAITDILADFRATIQDKYHV